MVTHYIILYCTLLSRNSSGAYVGAPTPFQITPRCAPCCSRPWGLHPRSTSWGSLSLWLPTRISQWEAQRVRGKEKREVETDPVSVPVRSLALAVSVDRPLLPSSVPPDSSGIHLFRLKVCPLGMGWLRTRCPNLPMAAVSPSGLLCAC